MCTNCVFDTDKWTQPNANKHETSTNKHEMHERVRMKAKRAQTGTKLVRTSTKCTHGCEWKPNEPKTNANEPKQAQNNREHERVDKWVRTSVKEPKRRRDRHDQVVQMNGGKDGEGSGRMCDPTGGGSDDNHGDGG